MGIYDIRSKKKLMKKFIFIFAIFLLLKKSFTFFSLYNNGKMYKEKNTKKKENILCFITQR